MRTEQELDALESAANSWVGTPFCENSAVKGAGASCHTAVLEVLVETGWLPRELKVPFPPLRAASVEIVSAFFKENWRYFLYVKKAEPGDILHFQLGRTSHFMLSLRGGRYFHSLEKIGCGIAPGFSPTFAKRLRGVWRVMS